MSRGRTKTWAAVAALGTLSLAMVPADAAPTPELVDVVVRASSPAVAAELIEDHDGTVGRELALIGGVSAQVSETAAAHLDAQTGVDVTLDEPLTFASTHTAPADNADVQLEAMNPGATWSLETGSGVGVALLDTGVAETPDLVGRVVHGPDYSDEGDGIDRYGHGTFMAGLIAGDGSASSGDAARHGVAPGAHIVSVKLAGRDGVTTLSKVLDAIGWVVTNQDEHGIRVMNLSIGVPTKVAPQADPLSAAVEAAWASGITVVAASGNEGNGTVTSPGRDPWVITVGSTDTAGTAATSDDTVPAWSGDGKVTRTVKPEVLAPGASVVSLRAPGSRIDEEHPEGRVDDAYFRGSGTSMSTALVSGAVAALAEFRPWATPDDLKGALVTTGAPIDATPAVAVDLAAADAAAASEAWQQDHAIVFNQLDGHLKHGMPWARADAADPELRWSRVRWADGEWARVRWADADFARVRWADADFARVRWADANFARVRWADANFARVRWADTDWARVRWAGQQWADDGSWVRVRWAATPWGPPVGR